MKFLSARKTRMAVAAQHVTVATLERVVVSFLNRGFVGRMKWLLFGK